MTLMRTALLTTTLAFATLGTGCASTQQPSSASANSNVRFTVMQNNHNPLAMGAGDSLGAAIFMTHGVN